MLNMNIKAAALTAVLASTCASALPTDLSERQVAVPYPPFSDGQANKYCKEWRWAGRALPPINGCAQLIQRLQTQQYDWLDWKTAKYNQIQGISEPEDCQLSMFSVVDVTFSKEDVIEFVQGTVTNCPTQTPEGYWCVPCNQQAGGCTSICSGYISVYPSVNVVL